MLTFRSIRLLIAFVTLAVAALLQASCAGPNAQGVVTTRPAEAGAAAGRPHRRRVVGFCQISDVSAWRTAQTKSVQDAAQRCGTTLVYVNAQQQQGQQIEAIRAFIRQRVDAIVLAPAVETGWTAVLREARAAGIPILLLDRAIDADASLYIGVIASDFAAQGRAAGERLAKAMGGTGRLVVLEGTPGSAPAEERQRGFREALAKHPGMQIIGSQIGEFARDRGKEAMAALLASSIGGSIQAVFAHNDDMALGALQAVEAAGRKPGKEILLVSIDGMHAALQAVVDGKLLATVDCSPLAGPTVFSTLDKVWAGEAVPARIILDDEVLDKENAAAALARKPY